MIQFVHFSQRFHRHRKKPIVFLKTIVYATLALLKQLWHDVRNKISRTGKCSLKHDRLSLMDLNESRTPIDFHHVLRADYACKELTIERDSTIWPSRTRRLDLQRHGACAGLQVSTHQQRREGVENVGKNLARLHYGHWQHWTKWRWELLYRIIIFFIFLLFSFFTSATPSSNILPSRFSLLCFL